jgi:hypothetical protein
LPAVKLVIHTVSPREFRMECTRPALTTAVVTMTALAGVAAAVAVVAAVSPVPVAPTSTSVSSDAAVLASGSWLGDRYRASNRAW